MDARLSEVAPSVEQSWVALQRKAKLYDKLKEERGPDLGGRADEDVLVDFVRKAYEAKEDSDSDGRPGKRKRTNEKAPVDDDLDPWVEYLDEFGRTRIARRSQVPALPPQPQQALAKGFVKAGQTAGTSDEPALLSKDMMIERERQEWEQSAQGELAAGAGTSAPRHYDSNREVRNLGVGFYQLAQDDEQRKEQLEELKSLRNQTKQARETERARKDKRKERLEERRKMLLAKVRRQRGEEDTPDEDVAKDQTAKAEDEVSLPEEKIQAVDDLLLSIRREVERSSGIRKKQGMFGDLLDDGP